MLSKPTIKHFRAMGHITIDPYVPENVGSAQVDVTLGRHFYKDADRQSKTWHPAIYNPFDEVHVNRKWELGKSVLHREWARQESDQLKGIGLDEEIIFLGPGELILAHTEEFIGGSCNFITTQMKARSSIGRNFLTVCACAGQGDVGYFTRWTFEIHNRSQHSIIPLVVGRRIAQILFFEVEPVAKEDMYGASGKYQGGVTLEQLKANWKPEDMLPKMFNDRESRRARGE